eukprot:GCRY01001735.1.p1 GENE.GCRY01001735.1~~GCRY01001735.1.p1  ORF type:complete len:423 (-),score=79.97 GCRY01001735.1:259-1527(-)
MEVENETQEALFERAQDIYSTNLSSALEILEKLFQETSSSKLKENVIYLLAMGYAEQCNEDKLFRLMSDLQPFFASLPKAKTAKIVRTIIDRISTLKNENTLPLQIKLCLEWISWALAEKRTFLKIRLQIKLASLYHTSKNYTESLQVITEVVTEVKQLDDKTLLVEVHLLEAMVYHALKHSAKAKGALVSSKTNASAVYCPPNLQAQMDLLSGKLHSDSDKDYKTAFSYFLEAFEGFNALDNRTDASNALSYMLLCKIMDGQYADVQQVLTTKLALLYSNRFIDDMKAITKAVQNRSVQDFKAVLAACADTLMADPFISEHLASLYDTMLEQNILRILSAFSQIEVERLAELLNLDAAYIEGKISRMILNKQLSGILDQETNTVIVFENVADEKLYQEALSAIEEASNITEGLRQKARALA